MPPTGAFALVVEEDRVVIVSRGDLTFEKRTARKKPVSQTQRLPFAPAEIWVGENRFLAVAEADPGVVFVVKPG
jgi:hypothetical protein